MFQMRIKELREKAGYKSQQSFADAFGVAQSTVGGWESGAREPNFATLYRLADFFHVPAGYLIDNPQEDRFSRTFRQNIQDYLGGIDPGDFSDIADAREDYRFLTDLASSTKPLSLEEACKAANMLGPAYTLDELVGLVPENEKSPDTEKSASGDGVEQQIMNFVSHMQPDQKALVLTIVGAFVSQNQGLSPSAPGSAAKVTSEFEHQNRT